MYIERSYKIKYIKDGKEVWAWLAPNVDPDQFNPIEKILVLVLKASEGKVLVDKDGKNVGPSVFINDESEMANYTEIDDPDKPEDDDEKEPTVE